MCVIPQRKNGDNPASEDPQENQHPLSPHHAEHPYSPTDDEYTPPSCRPTCANRRRRSQYRTYNTTATPTHAAATTSHPRYSWHHCHHVRADRWAWYLRLAWRMVKVWGMSRGGRVDVDGRGGGGVWGGGCVWGEGIISGGSGRGGDSGVFVVRRSR